MARVVHFEIHASDPDRAVAFYSSTFGWEIKKMGEEDYWLIMTGTNSPEEKGSEGRGIDGAILKRRSDEPLDGQAVNAYTCIIEVEDIDESLRKVKSNGGMQIVDKARIPQVGITAYGKDTEGNIFGLVQPET